MTSPEKTDASFPRRVLAGGLTALVVKTSLAPVERIKLLYETHTMFSTPDSARMLPLIKRIYVESGLRGFFKGNLLHLCRVIPNAAIKYSCFDTYKRWITELRPETAESLRAVNSKRALVNSVLAASMSGTTQISITYPLDVLRTRMMLSSRYSNAFECLRLTLQNEGIGAFYRGLSLSLMSVTFYSGFSLGLYDYLKTHRKFAHTLHLNNRFLIAMATATIASICTFPCDLVRHRVQLKGSLHAPVAEFTSASECARRILRTEGVRGLYRGVHLQILRSAPGTSLQLITYDWMKKMLGIEK